MLDVQRRPDIDAGMRAVRRCPASASDGGCPARWCGRIRRPGAGSGGAPAPRRDRTPASSGCGRRSACAAGSRSRRAAARFRAGRASRPGRRRHRGRRPLSLRAAGQHGVGLADAGRRAEKDLQMPAAFLVGEGEQRVRRSALAFIGGHRASSMLTNLGLQRVEREVEREHIDARLAEQAERAALDLALDQCADARLRAARAPWRPAAPGTARASGEISGSRPLPDVVTRSTGTAADGFSGLSASTSLLMPLGQRLAGRAEIRARRVARRCRAQSTVLDGSFGSARGRRRRPAVEILVAR